MTIHLKPELEELIKQDIQRGAYQSIDEYVEHAVFMLHEQETWLADHCSEIATKIEAGYAAAQRGELIDPNQAHSSLRRSKTGMAGWQTQGMIAYQFTSLAVEDLFEIWSYIAHDNPDAANAVEEAIYRACDLLAKAALAGRMRPDVTHLPLRFWFVQPYRNFVIVYDPQPSRCRLSGCSMAHETSQHCSPDYRFRRLSFSSFTR